MSKVTNAEVGTIGLIQEQPDGSICHIALNEEQSKALQIFLASLSKDKPLKKLPKQYNLILAKIF